MKCSDFLARFSEFYDGDPDLPDREAFREHVESCPHCAHYTKVVREGAEELRSLPGTRMRGDFWPRLQHRIYHVEDEERLHHGSSSATPAAAVALVAVVLAVVAWYPVLQQEDAEVDMPVIVVHEPPASELSSSTSSEASAPPVSGRVLPPEFQAPGFYDPRTPAPSDGLVLPGSLGMWDDSSRGRMLRTDHR